MNVKLVSITASQMQEKALSAEELLVYIARVSNPNNQLNTETSDKLLGFLIKNRHWSPFDMINMCVEVVTSRAIAHQVLRHWSIKPQEFSQRYAEATSYEPVELRLKADKNRQSSTTIVGTATVDGVETNDANDCVMTELLYQVQEHLFNGDQLYKRLIQAGIATESARFVLPLTTSTTMYLNGSVRSWIHYMEQRCDKHAQKEHREVANALKGIFMEQFPMTSKALGLCI